MIRDEKSARHLVGEPIETAELARRLELDIQGDGTRRISGLATLRGAGPGDLSFLANSRYREHLATTRAGAVILAADAVNDCSATILIAKDPYLAWAQAADLFHPPSRFEAGVHAAACVSDGAVIDESASIAAGAVIGAGCHLRAGVRVGPGCVLEENVEIGDDSTLVANVFLGSHTRLGKRVLVHPGAVIGADGFGLAMEDGRWRKVPQIGTVLIGDDCEIGANTTIDRGAIEATVLEEDVRVDNQVQIAHNVFIGAHTAIAGCAGIAGSTRIGRYCMIAGACGIAGHLEICDRVIITAMSTVLHSIAEPGEYGSAIPARPQRTWQRLLVRLKALEQFARRLKALERRKS